MHAFEANPQNKPKMDKFMARHQDWTNVVVHQPVAAWIKATTLSFNTDTRPRATGGSLFSCIRAPQAVLT